MLKNNQKRWKARVWNKKLATAGNSAKSEDFKRRREVISEARKKMIKETRQKHGFTGSLDFPLQRYAQGKGVPTETEILKGILWGVFARYIRKRDKGECISCGYYRKFEELQAGHYVAAGGSSNDLIFDDRNVNGECKQCNGFSADHLIPMRRNLINKYGVKVVEELESKRGLSGKHWYIPDFVEKINYYYQLTKKLK
jgi:hypothetical protein